MPIRRATAADIPTIRERLAELPHTPNLPEEDDVATLFEGKGNVALLGDAGEFAHAHWSEVNENTTIVYLLPEGMNLGRLAPIALAVLDAISAEFSQSNSRTAGGIFHEGFDPETSLEDYGESKANAWANFTQGQGADRPTVAPVYDSLGERIGTEARMPMALARSSLRRALRGH